MISDAECAWTSMPGPSVSRTKGSQPARANADIGAVCRVSSASTVTWHSLASDLISNLDDFQAWICFAVEMR